VFGKDRKVFVQMFDVSLGIWFGHGPGLRLFIKDCGKGLAIEHNGDLYSCDHFVYPTYQLGNIMRMLPLAGGGNQ
jgi:uncharacterized protein